MISDETREKLRKSHLGQKSVLKGKTYDEFFGKTRANKIKQKIRLKRLGNTNPRKGLTLTQYFGVDRAKEIRLILSKKLKGNSNAVGWHPTKEQRTKIKIARAKQVIKHSKQTKEKIRRHHIEHPNSWILRPRFSNTSIEIKIENELKKSGLVYQKQKSLEGIARVDFYIPSLKLVIFCDGNYWHKYPKGLRKDKIQSSKLTKAGYHVVRFWEHEINESASKCLSSALSQCTF